MSLITQYNNRSTRKINVAITNQQCGSNRSFETQYCQLASYSLCFIDQT